MARADLPGGPADQAAMDGVIAGLTAFTADLYRRLATEPGNLVCSPLSVAMALGMTVQGAHGATAAEMLAVLHAPSGGPAALATGLGTLDGLLGSRACSYLGSDGTQQSLALAAANSLWGQRGLVWQQPFLDVLARRFGTGMHQVDYVGATDAARHEINGWVDERTRHRIPELIASGLLDADTRLVLVDALYLKAAWAVPFESDRTGPQPFTRLDGSSVQADLMNADLHIGYAQGPGWVAATLPYAQGQLAMTVILPDAGRFAAIEGALDGEWLSTLLGATATTRVRIGLPRWTTRSQRSLGTVLAALGMPTAFGSDADFSGITLQERLAISAVVHEGWIAVDEAGTEAAAATAVVMRALSAHAPPEIELVADRPFLYVIHDVATHTPLFVGRVVDPS